MALPSKKSIFTAHHGTVTQQILLTNRCQQYRFRRKLTLFLEPTRFPAFHSKCPAFFAYFELEKMHSMRSFQRQVELRRLGKM